MPLLGMILLFALNYEKVTFIDDAVCCPNISDGVVQSSMIPIGSFVQVE